MAPATKAAALAKLDTYSIKVGYPDHARSYAGVDIVRNDLVGDVRRAARANWDYDLARVGTAVDRGEWQMTPQTVDSYTGQARDIVFPAALLQPPLYDPAADDAVNYGSIGVAIAHELIHGFDEQGRTVDAGGASRDWWTPTDAAAYKARANALGAQYSAFEPLPGLHVDAQLTMDENIADLGGLLVALDAYHASLKGHAAAVIGGLTGDQRFFTAYAQSLRGQVREDVLRHQALSDPHAYRKFRVLGPIRNIDAWYDAFKVHEGDKLYLAPGDRVRLW
jgi:putative endopeptidase